MAPVKIFEIKGEDWTSGLSRQTSSTLGGLFTSATNFDPFETNGFWQPSFAPQALSGVTASTTQFMTPFSVGGLGYIYAHASTKLYKIKVLDNSVTDETSNITIGSVSGAAIWRNKYLYALDTQVRKIELGADTDTQLLTGLTSGVPHIMCTGADLGLNEYVTNGSVIGKLVLETGTSGNTTSAFALETGMIARDLGNDGRYLVIISDNNSSGSVDIKSKCVVTFWDMVKSTADVIWEIKDTNLIGLKIVDGIVHVFGYNGIWACSAGTPPQIIYPYIGNSTITGHPSSAAAITEKNGVIYWGTNNSTHLVYAYGNPLDHNKKIFFTPYTVTGNTTAMVATTTKFFAGHDIPGIDELAVGTGVRTLSNIITAPIDFGQRFQFAYAKVVMKDLIRSGESFELIGINNFDGNGLVTSADVRSFSLSQDQSTLIFSRTPANIPNDVADFEQLSGIRLATFKKAVLRFSIYANPLEDQYQV